MKAKSPEQGLAEGSGDELWAGEALGLGHGTRTSGANVMSNARSSPGGFVLACDLSLYFHPLG
ncbi:MAG TPA: hypothetical protein VIJ91_05220 [Candidatus Dormibacteraeota bacterium]